MLNQTPTFEFQLRYPWRWRIWLCFIWLWFPLVILFEIIALMGLTGADILDDIHEWCKEGEYVNPESNK